MQETQLACPHCGSMLNFGTQIAAGTQVECLICMRTFAADPQPAQPKLAKPAAPEPASTSVPVAQLPAAKPAANAVTAKVAPKAPPPLGKPAKPSAPRIRRIEEAPAATGKLALIAMALGLVLVLGAGASVVAWKFLIASHHAGDAQIVLDTGGDPENPDQFVDQLNPAKGNPQAKKADAAGEVIDEDTAKIKAAEKKLLVRKTPTASGPEHDWTLPVNFKADEQRLYAGLTQKRIDQVIEKGIAYLRKTQQPNGTWSSSHPIGHAALSGLTMLECGMPPNDPVVQRAAQFVRAGMLNNEFTYELSLSILFLDRLGDPRDRPLIQGMALRLLAGQNDCGGWTYTCMLLNPQEMYQLYVFLHSNRQPNLLNPLFGTSDRNPITFAGSSPRDVKGSGDAFQHFGALMAKGIESAAKDAKDGKNPPAKQKATAPLRPEWLKANLQNIPVVRNQGKGKGKVRLAHGSGDNSNTQFALLALWASRRHDIPCEQAIMAAYQRFVSTQNVDGGWGYSNNHSQNTSGAMTAVGLLGLAMGHGTSPDVVKFDPKNPKDSVVRPALEDPRIQNGLKTLSGHIGQPIVEGQLNQLLMQNLYLLWSIERVAMLYDLKTINGKEWYPWGAQILVQNQSDTGSWPSSLYPGSDASVNTCFALLFLKRSNLVQDLTNNLRLYTGIRDPEK
jgi:hypothetical protein